MTVNFREGMRRLGLLLGLLGAGIGAIAAYDGTRAAWNTYTAHRRFEALVASPTVQRAAKAGLGSGDPYQLSDERRAQLRDIIGKMIDNHEEPDDIDYIVKYFKQKYGNTALRPNRGGIESVHFDSSGVVTSIQLSTGGSVEKTEAPQIWAFLPLLIYPALGFLIPWGAVRVVTWVVGGFAAPHP